MRSYTNIIIALNLLTRSVVENVTDESRSAVIPRVVTDSAPLVVDTHFQSALVFGERSAQPHGTARTHGGRRLGAEHAHIVVMAAAVWRSSDVERTVVFLLTDRCNGEDGVFPGPK